jgi:acetyl esterase
MKALTDIILEKTTESFIDKIKSQGGKPLYKMTPEEARQVLDKIQSEPVKKPKVQVEDKTIPVGPKGKTSIKILRPQNVQGELPVVVYVHGAGWILGNYGNFERLVCDLVDGAQVGLVFVNYSLSPENRYPTALEEIYETAKYISENGKQFNFDGSRLAIAGDSVGGNMATAVSLLAKERKGPRIKTQVLFYPVTNSELTSESYQQFSDGPWLTKPAMEWFWNAYEPDAKARQKPSLSPLNATIDQLKGLPKALVITAENDVLRDEGEAYAHKLMQAEVDVTAVRFEGTIHDFVMLNALAHTPATRGAIALACSFLKQHL